MPGNRRQDYILQGRITPADAVDAPKLPAPELIPSKFTGSIRLVVPYTNLHPKTKSVAESVGAEFLYVGNSDYDYAELLENLFREQRPFIIIEQDMVPTIGQLQALADCPEPLCGHPFMYHPNGIAWALGCVKISGEALAAHIDWNAKRTVFQENYRAHWKDAFWRVETQLTMENGLDPHFHKTLVQHYGIKYPDTDELVVPY